jgi:hypothetical protein
MVSWVQGRVELHGGASDGKCDASPNLACDGSEEMVA